MNTMGKPGVNDRGIYDDAMFVLSPDTFTSFNANNDPSVYRRGYATLISPQKIPYRHGWHGYGRASGHYAFRQAGPVIVHRDEGIGNGHALGDGLFTDRGTARFWCNIHRGGYNTTSSAGCQTIPPNQWEAFYNIVRVQQKRFDQKVFNCYLIDGPLT
jgi:lysozyme